VGLVMTLLTLFLYLPILLMASGVPAVLEGANYVWDTLLFAGAVLLVAEGASSKLRSLDGMTLAKDAGEATADPLRG
jgi:hypothetical protein